MALAVNTIFHIQDSATASNVNGAGFNPNNANMLTNLTADTNTGNTASPVVSSASYNFTAADVGAYLFIQAGTNWIPGWYQIVSVAANKATLNATIGQAQTIQYDYKAPSTVLGCATVGTPTGGTFTIDYSQNDTAFYTNTNFTSSSASTTISSVGGTFHAAMVGNYLHLTAAGTNGVVGWYEIVSRTSATAIVLDRTPNTGAMSGVTAYVGGAGSNLEDAFGEIVPEGATVWIKAGNYAPPAAFSISANNGTDANPIVYNGFNTYPGDDPRGDTPGTEDRPVINMGANAFSTPTKSFCYNLVITGTAATLAAINGVARYCKVINTSTSANRVALNCVNMLFCELISQNGYASASASKATGCYFHDSVYGLSASTVAGLSFLFCIFANMASGCIRGITSTAGNSVLSNNTFYGRASSPIGTGIEYSVASVGNRLLNNIFTSLATAVTFSANSLSNRGAYNDFYNNTTDATNYSRDNTDLAVDPQFSDVAEIAFSTGAATGGTAVLTVSGGDFSAVQDNVDFVRILSATGGTGTIVANYLIVSHTTTTLTVNNNIGSSGSITDIVGYIQTGHNYAIGTNLKAGVIGAFPGSDTTQYLDIGAAQRQEAGGGGGGLIGGGSLTGGMQ